MTPVELPAPSAALVLHMAAARIRATAEQALTAMKSSSYWDVGWPAGVTDAIGGPEGELAALLPPQVAVALADWLAEQASAHTLTGATIPHPAVVIAAATRPNP